MVQGLETDYSMKRVVIGMSGGVDSSAAAAMLVDQGWTVIGVTLHLWDYQREGHAGRCCAPEDQYDAKRACEALGIAHYTFDRRELFRSKVVDPFIDDYARGKTPSPCVRCNEHVKLGPLWQIAQRLGASHVASGHYARVAVEDSGRVLLSRAVDLDRDQSYFLWAAEREALKTLVLPLGELTKPQVRAYAERRGVPRFDKPDSTDLCFVEGQSYGDWVEKHGVAPRSGPIENIDGTQVATHDGLHKFTVGQRRGTGKGNESARYVLKIIPERNAVVIGSSEQATQREVVVGELRWFDDAAPADAVVKLRYRHEGVRCRVVSREDDLRQATVVLEQPQRGVAPGQAAVFYDGDRVLGGGFILH
jgi:tRNA-specific 2-thiouridylase